MPILEPEGRPYAEVDRVGLAILRTPLGYHSGLLYWLDQEDPRLLHLAFHHDLRDDAARAPLRWTNLNIDDVNKVVLAEILARIAGTEQRIAYGFNSDGIVIDPETGEVIPGPSGHGHTCATFIIAILKAHAYDLIDLTEWPVRPSDVAFQETIVAILEEKGYGDHAAVVRKDIGRCRIRPEEVVGAGTVPEDKWSVPFEIAEPLGRQVAAEV